MIFEDINEVYININMNLYEIIIINNITKNLWKNL